MRIVVCLGNYDSDHPSFAVFATLLNGIEHDLVRDRVPGEIAALPCIAAVRADGVAVYSGGVELTAEQIAEWAEESEPAPPAAPKVPTISRTRFDAVFAFAVGDLEYETVLDTIAAVAATSPMTEDSAKVRRAWRALNSVATVDYPAGPWRNASLDDANGDLTGQFLKLVASILVGDIPDIADKIDAGLEAWPEI